MRVLIVAFAASALSVSCSARPDQTAGERVRQTFNPAEAKMAGDILRSSHAPAAGPIQHAAATSVALDEWWAPPGNSPYLILQGSLDQAAPAENGELLAEELGDRAKLVSIEGAGHLMLITSPQICSSEIVRFLNEEASQ